MCHKSCIDFVHRALSKEDIEGKSVLEIGAHDVNGTTRGYIEGLKPSKYLGIDIAAGKGVDEVCSIYNIVDRYAKASFDVVINTEVMEHIKDWPRAISNIKQVVRTGGRILLTTRSYGFAYHGWPYDFWRFEVADIKSFFSDFTIEILESDWSCPGVFIKAKKPDNFVEKSFSSYPLYSIVSNKSCTAITGLDYFKSIPRLFPYVFRERRDAVCKAILPTKIKAAVKKLFKLP